MLRRAFNQLVNPPASHVGEAVQSRVAGALWIAGGMLVGLSLALPHPAEADDSGLLAISIAAVVSGSLFIRFAPEVPQWLVHAYAAAGSTAICATIYLSSLAVGVYSTMFVWVAVFSAYFFSRGWALAQLAWALACYAVVLGLVDSPGFSPVTRWVVGALALIVVTVMTSWLITRRRAAEVRVERFFDLSQDMLCTANTDGYLVELNGAWKRVLGYGPRELRSRPLIELVHPDDRPRAEVDARRLFAKPGRAIEFENRCRAKDGSWRWLRWSSTYVADKDLVYARATDVTERAKLLEQLRDQAQTDELTGLPNRRWLADELARELARADRQGLELSLAVLDLDHFKRFNDERGHLAGDNLLRATASAWRHELRVSDFLARYGGEEFVVLLPDCDAEAAREVIERVAAVVPEGQTVSAGIVARTGTEDADDLIARADDALYVAKRSGRDRVVVGADPDSRGALAGAG